MKNIKIVLLIIMGLIKFITIPVFSSNNDKLDIYQDLATKNLLSKGKDGKFSNQNIVPFENNEFMKSSLKNVYSSLEDSLFIKLPPEIIRKIMDYQGVYSSLIATSYSFFYLGSHPAVVRTFYINSRKDSQYYSNSSLKLYQLPRVKISELESFLELFNSHSNFIIYLTHLNLSNICLGENINLLTNLVNLNTLNVFGSEIADNVVILSALSNLTDLNIGFNNIKKDVTVLTSLQKVRFLDLSFNLITDITELITLDQMMDLNLCNNPLRDYSTLKYFVNLTSLDVGYQNLTNQIQTLASLTQLENLNISCSQVREQVTMLTNLTNLKTLDISYNFVEEYLPFLQCLQDNGCKLLFTPISRRHKDLLNDNNIICCRSNLSYYNFIPNVTNRLKQNSCCVFL